MSSKMLLLELPKYTRYVVTDVNEKQGSMKLLTEQNKTIDAVQIDRKILTHYLNNGVPFKMKTRMVCEFEKCGRQFVYMPVDILRSPPQVN